MKEEHTASRTLVKSAPELWAECSVAASLTRHLGQFGEIKITRLEPETAVAWEGERASGTVRLEPSGWGTQVTITARTTGAESAPEPAADEVCEEKQEHEDVVEVPELEADEPEPEPDPEPRAGEAAPLAVAPRPRGLLARLRGLLRGRPAPAPDLQRPPVGDARPLEGQPETEPAPEPVSEPVIAAAEPRAVLAPAEAEPGAVLAPAAAEPGAVPAPAAGAPESVLVAALDSLGQAHHRPFSRA
jgi:hypothetical protein